MDMAESYKSAKEAFVSDKTGSSIGHINQVSLAALLSVSLYGAFKTRLVPNRNLEFLFSWTILVLPLLLSMTVFADDPKYLIAFLLLPNILLLRMSVPASGTPLPSITPTTAEQREQNQPTSPTFPPLPALTTYRAHMMLMTVLAILAVDFPVFPRSLVKCETYGVSLMDLGVGSFVFSQGVVSAIPLVKDQNYIRAPFLPKLIRVTSKSLPIIVLGLIRVLLVKGTDYPEHVTEYGVHWNFFITLALLPVMQVILHPILHRYSTPLVGVSVGIFQQLLLTFFSFKYYVLNAPRTSLVSANKEGIVSLLGYLSIHLLGLSIGTLILPPTPSFFRRRQQALLKLERRKNGNASTPTPKAQTYDVSAGRQTDKTATELCAYAILWWGILGIMKLIGVEGKWSAKSGISRRMVNLPYIIWVVAYNTSFLLAYLVVLDMWIFSNPSNTSVKSKNFDLPRGKVDASTTITSTGYLNPPGGTNAEFRALESGNPAKLFVVINKHGLPIFLIANVFTGLINLSIPTIYVSDVTAMGILSGYSLAICAVGWVWPSGSQKKQGFSLMRGR